jgi:hypothetical protein
MQRIIIVLILIFLHFTNETKLYRTVCFTSVCSETIFISTDLTTNFGTRTFGYSKYQCYIYEKKFLCLRKSNGRGNTILVVDGITHSQRGVFSDEYISYENNFIAYKDDLLILTKKKNGTYFSAYH